MSKKYFATRKNPKTELPATNPPNESPKNLFHDESETPNSNNSLNSSPRPSDSASWKWPEHEEEVFPDEMNIDLGEYDIDETGLDGAFSDSEPSDSNGTRDHSNENNRQTKCGCSATGSGKNTPTMTQFMKRASSTREPTRNPRSRCHLIKTCNYFSRNTLLRSSRPNSVKI